MLLYHHSDSDKTEKFVYNEVLKKQILNPELMESVYQYNILKVIVNKCKNKNDQVDTKFLLSLCNQVRLKCEFFGLEKRFNGFRMEETKMSILQSALYELQLSDPVTIEEILSHSSHKIEEVDQKVSDVKSMFEQFQSDLLKKLD